ncbi:SIS domain-containing protein [Tateyamaria omphalii]|uniref:SIS domain-containing protein n=1 Tax=Tateyamaria omphalii TaxID=299262 RepID=UPI001C9911D3|nr:SIS domain-containing protein [Tateyamaria omphalii]MBY5934996.1 SIS domain-containing protein [Tateyamaria omphalii]
MSPTYMRQEIDEIPEAARRLAQPEVQDVFVRTASALRAHDPRAIVTIARGSSDHAATCLKYAFELVAGVPVASLGPSVATIYGAQLRFDRVTAFGISQSGQSTDLVQMMECAGAGGAQTVTLTNQPDSPLAMTSSHVLDVHAGPEHAVAATKSYTNSILTGLWLAAHWQQDHTLLSALQAMPDRLETASTIDFSSLSAALAGLDRIAVISRGPSLGIAYEVALKAMEVCTIPAIAYSNAEVLHGPSAVLKHGYPVLPISGGPATGLADTLAVLRSQGAFVLPTVSGLTDTHPALPVLDVLIPIYGALEEVSRRRGLNPDKPAGLAKVTDTI